MCGCSHMTTTTMELPSLVCVCVLISCGVSSADANERVKVKEGSDAILPCSLSTKEDITFKWFDWKKEGQNKVFIYDAGRYYDNGFSGLDKQFKGRVSHFPDQLKNGIASIKIQKTKVADSGNYTCDFPHLQPGQTFLIELVVGAASKPYVKPVQTKDGMKLQCEVFSAFPKPKVEWKDSSGKTVPAEEPKITKRGGSYDIILQATVTKTDLYWCVVTQEEINHQIENDIDVTLGASNGWIVAFSVVSILLAAVCILLGVLYCKGFIKVNRQSTTGSNENSTAERQNLNSR